MNDTGGANEPSFKQTQCACVWAAVHDSSRGLAGLFFGQADPLQIAEKFFILDSWPLTISIVRNTYNVAESTPNLFRFQPASKLNLASLIRVFRWPWLIDVTRVSVLVPLEFCFSHVHKSLCLVRRNRNEFRAFLLCASP